MDSKKAKENRRRYDSDFKNEVLKMVESGRPVPEIAQSLGIGNNLIYYWIRQAKKAVPKQQGTAVLSLDEEKMALQKRVKELEMEREILKKALGIFSRPM